MALFFILFLFFPNAQNQQLNWFRESWFKSPSLIACLLDRQFSQFSGSVSFFFIVLHSVGKIGRPENRGSRGNVDLQTPAIERTIHSFLQNKTKW